LGNSTLLVRIVPTKVAFFVFRMSLESAKDVK
jgi:hypothetical protein